MTLKWNLRGYPLDVLSPEERKQAGHLKKLADLL